MYFQDAGQKLIGAVQCNNCGLTYNPQDGTDYATHQKFHAKVLHTLRFKVGIVVNPDHIIVINFISQKARCSNMICRKM